MSLCFGFRFIHSAFKFLNLMMSNPAVYDLHTHSNFSDGDLCPSEVVSLAKESGVTHLALTDHDTLSGLDEASSAADQLGLNFISGIELSCTWRHQLLHVVGLNVDAKNSGLKQGVAANQQRRRQRARLILDDLLQHNIDLRPSIEPLLESHQLVARPHFAAALVGQGLAKNMQQAFKRYLVPKKPGYIPMVWGSLQEVGEWITKSGGVAVLAHPARYKFTRTKLVALIEEMKLCGIDGMEVTTPTTTVQQSKMLADLCVSHNLMASSGSDFHSSTQPWARIGGAQPLPSHLHAVWQRF